MEFHIFNIVKLHRWHISHFRKKIYFLYKRKKLFFDCIQHFFFCVKRLYFSIKIRILLHFHYFLDSIFMIFIIFYCFKTIIWSIIRFQKFYPKYTINIHKMCILKFSNWTCNGNCIIFNKFRNDWNENKMHMFVCCFFWIYYNFVNNNDIFFSKCIFFFMYTWNKKIFLYRKTFRSLYYSNSFFFWIKIVIISITITKYKYIS